MELELEKFEFTGEDILSMHREWITKLYIEDKKTEIEIVEELHGRRFTVTVRQIQQGLREWNLLQPSSTLIRVVKRALANSTPRSALQKKQDASHPVETLSMLPSENNRRSQLQNSGGSVAARAHKRSRWLNKPVDGSVAYNYNDDRSESGNDQGSTKTETFTSDREPPISLQDRLFAEVLGQESAKDSITKYRGRMSSKLHDFEKVFESPNKLTVYGAHTKILDGEQKTWHLGTGLETTQPPRKKGLKKQTSETSQGEEASMASPAPRAQGRRVDPALSSMSAVGMNGPSHSQNSRIPTTGFSPAEDSPFASSIIPQTNMPTLQPAETVIQPNNNPWQQISQRPDWPQDFSPFVPAMGHHNSPDANLRPLGSDGVTEPSTEPSFAGPSFSNQSSPGGYHQVQSLNETVASTPTLANRNAGDKIVSGYEYFGTPDYTSTNNIRYEHGRDNEQPFQHFEDIQVANSTSELESSNTGTGSSPSTSSTHPSSQTSLNSPTAQVITLPCQSRSRHRGTTESLGGSAKVQRNDVTKEDIKWDDWVNFQGLSEEA